MPKIKHYQPFGWQEYRADHETFPSDPANDLPDYLTIVYLNSTGIHMATCEEGESLAYQNDRSGLVRRLSGSECFISDVPALPPFGSGMECSWAAALTAALRAMKIPATYEEVMGVSGACYRLAFCSPAWDYSSVDGLVAYDYATPGFAAYGFTPKMYCHIEKKDRPLHRDKIMKEIRNQMPVLGINLRVAPEWGVICGYAKDGEDLFCRTKYDLPTIENDPVFMEGFPPFDSTAIQNPYNYLYVDNWPFLLCYFDEKRKAPSPKENLVTSLKVFLDSTQKTKEGGYYLSFQAYETWAADLRDDAFYENCGDELLARRFSVNQFCTLALTDARKSAHQYLSGAAGLFPNTQLEQIAGLFGQISEKALYIHKMLDSGQELDGSQAREFWTAEKRHRQAQILDEMAALEREAMELSKLFLKNLG